jgi:integrase
MHLRRRGKIIYGTVYVDGQRVERSTGCTDEEAAGAILASWEREAVDPDRATSDATLNDALSLLLDERRARASNGRGSNATVTFYEMKAGHLVRCFGHDFRIAGLKDSTEVWKFIDARRREKAKDTSIAKEVITLRAALRLAKERGLWRGDLDAIIPDTFDPEYKPKNRSPSRPEVLRLLPHLPPNSAAAATFILATSAEGSALRRARRDDVPDRLDIADMRVPVRGTKNPKRNRLVAIVSDEQRMMLKYSLRHAEGTEGMLFGPLHNFRRDLACAAIKAGIPRVSPHDLRRASGQWLVDIGVPLELVSRLMGHADTRITEHVYAHVRDEDVVNRMIDSLDPRYARVALKARGKKKLVKTLTKLPEPKQRALYEVRGIERTLTEWAFASGISKTTLFHRIRVGMSMAEALALGRGRRGRRLAITKARKNKPPVNFVTASPKLFDTAVQETARKPMLALVASDDCRTRAANDAQKVDVVDAEGPSVASASPAKQAENTVARAGIAPFLYGVREAGRVFEAERSGRSTGKTDDGPMAGEPLGGEPPAEVARAGIEPATRGFSVRCSTN